jgi:hypothetical protein
MPESYCNMAARAARAGNSESIIALNQGTANMFKLKTSEQDYAAGEISRTKLAPEYYPSTHKTEGGMQWHIAIILGTWWGNSDGPRYTNKEIGDYVKRVVDEGGGVTIDVGFESDGTIYAPHLERLKAAKQAVGPTSIRPFFSYIQKYASQSEVKSIRAFRLNGSFIGYDFNKSGQGVLLSSPVLSTRNANTQIIYQLR